MDDLITTAQAAKLLNVSRGRILQLRKAGQLTGKFIGRDLFFDATAVKSLVRRPAGRPKSIV